MDVTDRDIQEAEREASPDRFPNVVPYTGQLTSSLSHPSPSARGSTTSHGGNPSRTKTRELVLDPIELSRIHTQRLQHRSTVGSIIHVPHRPPGLQDIGAGKPFPPLLSDPEEYVVEFLGSDDALHPQNWRMQKKVWTSVILAFITLVASFASAIFSPAIHEVGKKFHVSDEVSTLGVSLYVLGFAFGPLIWAPLSELVGRSLPLQIGIFGFSLFEIAVATAKDYQTIMLCRFFAGFFSASPLAVVPACYADIWNNKDRGIAITIFAMAVFIGPFASPFVGGFITMSYLGWRWTMYITSFMGFLSFGLVVLFLQETYAPAILIAKAGKLRRQTKNWGIHAKQEEVEVDFHELLTNNFSRPLKLLVTEPIVLLMTIYMSFIYGLIYVFLSAYPLVFQGIHGMNLGVGGLPFIGLIIGQLLAGVYIVMVQGAYNRKLVANNNVPIPEWRLPTVMVGSFAFAGGLFWFGWTGFDKSIHWIVPTASGVMTGFGFLCIFLQCFNYIIDSYLMFAASAVAANSLLRSLAGAGFPLFAVQTFNNLGIQWAGTLLGCLAAVMIPIPFIFYKYGPKIRARSQFAPTVSPEDSEEPEDDGKQIEV